MRKRSRLKDPGNNGTARQTEGQQLGAAACNDKKSENEEPTGEKERTANALHEALKDAEKKLRDPGNDGMRQTEGQQLGDAACSDSKTAVGETEGQQLEATATKDLCTWLEREAEIWRWGQRDRGKVPMKREEKQGTSHK